MSKRPSSRPPGWVFKSTPPSSVSEFIDWISTRTGWLHEFIAKDEVVDEFATEIVREFQRARDCPKQFVRAYVRQLMVHVRFWLDHHEIPGQPIWHPVLDGYWRELRSADEHLSSLLSFLRGLGKKRATDKRKRGPKRKRGGQQKYDPKDTKKVADAWKGGRGQFRDLHDLGKQFGMTHAEVVRALDRVRHKKNPTPE